MRCAEKVAAAYRLGLADAMDAVRAENECNCSYIFGRHTPDCAVARNLRAIAAVIEADPDSQFVWVKFVDAQTVMDVAVNAAENLAYERGVKAGRALWIDDVGGRGL